MSLHFLGGDLTTEGVIDSVGLLSKDLRVPSVLKCPGWIVRILLPKYGVKTTS